MAAAPTSLRAYLPRGHRLPAAAWEARHRAMLSILWIHVPVYVTWGVLNGDGAGHALLDVAPLAGPALVASSDRLSRRAREVSAALGLLSASAMLVHLMNGAIEAHFHFFVIVALLALYEEWFPYLLAFAFVLVHHAVMSTVSPQLVFNAEANVAHPWRWSLVHAAFIGAQGVICLVGWKVNEDARGAAADSEGRFGSAFSDAPIGMALVGADGVVRQANDALLRHWDMTSGGRPLTGQSLRVLVRDEDLDSHAFPGPAPLEVRHADGTGWGQWRHAPLLDEAGDQAGWISHCIDITTSKRLESALSWQAHHDPLTRLPNRTLFLERLEVALASGAGATVVFVDLDDFKVINDSLGHGEGDRLLCTISERLQAALRPQDLVARFGGDEFVVLLPGVDTDAVALSVVARLADEVREPVVLAGEGRFVAASIGICVCETGEVVDADLVLRDADAAMYRAKSLGKGRCEIFDEVMRSDALERLALESALRTVLERDELVLVYQPLVDLATRKISGVEALLRWRHPEIGVVSPMEFIPLAEGNGTIVPIGSWVIDEACRQLAAWDEPGLQVSVNVASQQLEQPSLVDVVRASLARHGVPASCLCLEITETAVLGDTATTSATLAALTELGVGLAVDDFGVGYASLSHLRQLLPVDTLKIDKSFVDGVINGVEDAAIVAGVIGLAHSLGLAVVAEGIEQAEQAELLTRWGCETGQGYHFARPLPPGEIAERLASGLPLGAPRPPV